MTISRQIAQDMIQKQIASNDKRFPQTLRKTCLDGDEMIVPILPNIYRICENDFCKAVICYEIEDTNKLSKDKLFRYAELWFQLDSNRWDLYLYPVYRDGTIGVQIDLFLMFRKLMKEEWGFDDVLVNEACKHYDLHGSWGGKHQNYLSLN